ncbi:luciferase family oxidoreductase group 1 [Friedmanniella endophytica]|uniref:Luciferase family oxidoreductase group 1 n=1 Tax=Microlunatus kandeliicorticis TaxID=1759536 RepID=A0A7W3ISI8_9ACTN|nr:LLM class flavin-dependent oxidoreductase [Microlunatus kandeliicorticis]MBA8794434.1 luciferase family oxidoreductase group 1 [Microlunatus kandeliicorticis]
MTPQTRVPLSVLDLSPIGAGQPASAALRETVELARAAERFGYQRYWLAEHHNIPSVASSAPAVMIATVAAHTSTIRVGSGGIMLPNHAPLQVAETFRVLEALHPGRIDLGLGRAPGTDQLTAPALRRSREALTADDFPQQFAELMAYVDGFPADHPFARITAIPTDVDLPPVWILGSSLYGGQAAGAFGTGFAFAGHFGTADPAEAVRGYRERFTPSARLSEPRVILGVAAIAAETTERAEQLARAADLSMLRLRQGRPGPLPTPEEAAAYDWSLAELAQVESRRVFTSVGTADEVVDDLERRRKEADADELIITTQIHDPAERIRSYELIAESYR